MSQPLQQPYVEKDGAAAIISPLMLVISLLSLAASTLVFTMIPTYQASYEEYHMAQPWLTALVVSVPLWVYWVVVGVTAAILVAKEFFIRNRRITVVINAVAAGLIVAALVVVYVAVRLPMANLADTMR